MQIEEGKYYRTREGEKVGPAARSGLPDYPWRASETLYTDKGEWEAPGKTHRRDIVAEWDDGMERGNDPTPPVALLVTGEEGDLFTLAEVARRMGLKAVLA